MVGGKKSSMDIGNVKFIDIDKEMRGSYLDYAMSVIVARALPDVRDGLKPVQRRILYAMHDMGLRPDRPYKKSARIVGEVLGKYHPHGDAAVYDAMVRLAQDFSMRYPLVDGQGNFGSVDGDSAAAMRYTEARLAEIAEEMLTDIEKETVDFDDNFDGSLVEPAVLPAKLPNLLLSGTSGIAVGMATNVPPHNLAEICQAVVYLIDNYDDPDSVSVEDLMKYIPGPDFPTGALILGKEGIRAAYATGRGRVLMRAKTTIEEMRGGRYSIIVTELPYQVNKAGLIEKIAELVRNGRLKDIADLRDESDRHGLRIVVELKRGSQPRKVLNQLFKYTPMQSTFGVNMLALVEGQPRVLSLKQALRNYVEHRREIISRRSKHDLTRARERAHILEGLLMALAQLDAVIATIRRSATAAEALRRLRKKFKLTKVQAQAILDMQLKRLAALEQKRLEEEHGQIIGTITYLEDLLASPAKILSLIKDDLLELARRFGDQRRTIITAEEAGDFDEEDLIADEKILITITQRGYIKRVLSKIYRAQARGGRGITGMSTREEDEVQDLFAASTLDYILFFTNRGRVFQQRAYHIPDASRQAKGLPLVNLLALKVGESVTAAVAVSDFLHGEYLVMVTRQGRIKRTVIDQFSSVRPSGLIAINLADEDELGWVKLTKGEQEMILITEQGQAIRFNEEEVSPMSRSAAGVIAIRLADGDFVAGMDLIAGGEDLVVVTARGFGKRTALAQYPSQARYGKGVRTLDARRLDDTGPIVDARVVKAKDEITLISAEGMVIRTPVAEIPRQGRATKGVKLMNLKEGDYVVSLARLEKGER
ncbi:MAG: DNA gyrase subunit A [Anaerolineae bacterium]